MNYSPRMDRLCKIAQRLGCDVPRVRELAGVAGVEIVKEMDGPIVLELIDSDRAHDLRAAMAQKGRAQ